MKNISDSIKKLWQRSMCFFLAMITVLSLCPTASSQCRKRPDRHGPGVPDVLYRSVYHSARTRSQT